MYVKFKKRFADEGLFPYVIFTDKTIDMKSP